MNHVDSMSRSSLSGLAQEVRLGLPQAEERFIERMRPQMERMVRQTVRQHGRRPQEETSPQNQRILAEYQLVCQASEAPFCLSREEIVAQVARRLCESMVGQLRSERSHLMARETVRC